MTEENAPDNPEGKDGHEDEDEPVLGTMLEADSEESKPEQKNLSLGFVLSGFVLASLVGGFIGVVVPKVFQHPGQGEQQRDELKTGIEALQQSAAERDKLIENLVGRLQKQQTVLAGLDKMDAALLAAQEKQQQEFTAFVEQVSGLKAKTNRQAGHNNTINLETKTRPVATKSNLNIAPASLNILIETFPRQKMLAALLAQEQQTQKNPGWLRRVLRKHVKVRREDTTSSQTQTQTNPRAFIANAEQAVGEGRIQDALDIIANLNPTIRAAAAGWVRAARKTLQQ